MKIKHNWPLKVLTNIISQHLGSLSWRTLVKISKNRYYKNFSVILEISKKLLITCVSFHLQKKKSISNLTKTLLEKKKTISISTTITVFPIWKNISHFQLFFSHFLYRNWKENTFPRCTSYLINSTLDINLKDWNNLKMFFVI